MKRKLKQSRIPPISIKNKKTKNEQSPLILTELTQHKKDHEFNDNSLIRYIPPFGDLFNKRG
jgi:hypothetical protein